MKKSFNNSDKLTIAHELPGPKRGGFVFQYFQESHCSRQWQIRPPQKEHAATHLHQSCKRAVYQKFGCKYCFQSTSLIWILKIRKMGSLSKSILIWKANKRDDKLMMCITQLKALIRYWKLHIQHPTCFLGSFKRRKNFQYTLELTFQKFET